MTTQQAQEKLKTYVDIYVNIVKKAVNSKEIDGLKAGRMALSLLGCPVNVIDSIEDSLLKELNKK